MSEDGQSDRLGRAPTGVPNAIDAVMARLPGEDKSPPSDDGLIEDLRVAARAAFVGGRAACRFYESGELEVEQKGVNDPVTAADHASNTAILGVLRESRPADAILSEESAPPETRRLGGRLWVVDPLDGTKEFIARNGEFSIMVGLARGGSAVLGAVYQPAIDRLYLGIPGRAAWVVTDVQQGAACERMSVADTAPVGEALRFVRSRSHPDPRLRALESALGAIVTVVSGSVGIKCALIARGEADLYVHPVPYLKEWDTCAPEAILRGAGGAVTDCSGEPLSYGKPDPRQPGGIFAAHPEVWRRTASAVLDVTRPLFETETN